MNKQTYEGIENQFKKTERIKTDRTIIGQTDKKDKQTD